MNIERYVQAAASIGKPLMVGETGTGGAVKNDDPKNKKIYDETPDYFDAYTEPTAAKWVQSLCDEIVSAGPQLAYFWSYSTDHAPNKKAINWNIKKGEADPVLAVILDANKRLKAKLGAQ